LVRGENRSIGIRKIFVARFYEIDIKWAIYNFKSVIEIPKNFLLHE
jgi:hypothetical protein